MDNRPIAIFDSGMGGLTVRAAVARALPCESLVYFGDGARVPYGSRPREEIIGFVDEAVERLIAEYDVKMVVVACNAATGAAIDHLREKYRELPIIGMEPAVKPAARSTETGVVGVLATVAALRGELYRATAARYGEQVRIIEAVGEGFVELVEADREETPEAFETVRRVVRPMLTAGADRIVLGCTHYPFLAGQIRRVIDEFSAETGSPRARIVDSASAIARRAEQLLGENNLQAEPDNTPRYHFMTFSARDYIEHLKRKSVAANSILVNFP
jgi:glutamate racemase